MRPMALPFTWVERPHGLDLVGRDDGSVIASVTRVEGGWRGSVQGAPFDEARPDRSEAREEVESELMCMLEGGG